MLCLGSDALASLPRNLEETYQRMIERIPVELKKDAIRLLQFLVHSKQPLKLAEAQEVVATQVKYKPREFDVERRLLRKTDVFRGMAVVDTNKELHLAHFSVKEYLLGKKQFNIVTASISITWTCLTYLTDINGSYEEMKRNFPRAICHVALAQASEDIVRATVRFLEKEVMFQQWTRLYQADRAGVSNPGSPQGSRLYYVCFVGLIAPARDLISKGADIDVQGGYYGNALQAASLEGHQEIVKLFLEKGVDLNPQRGYHVNALQAVLSKGHQEIRNNKPYPKRGWFRELLTESDADLNAYHEVYGSALNNVSYCGHQEIVQLLLGHGADVEIKGDKCGDALNAAVKQGNREIPQLLIRHAREANPGNPEYSQLDLIIHSKAGSNDPLTSEDA
ncbi:ankyrin repeat protein [Triangularia setosa]|uniref:Ankyrin repeat protein n=1 Tax=Triangularia setosa TaxID=2587417 RepID=A0AAN6W130_9PEZI|nr:ankyrin repeat protein [Podospora setosa]